jgi:hypothetical protein
MALGHVRHPGNIALEGSLMSPKISGVAELNFDDIEYRVYEKYEVTRSDSQLAVEYLRCFLDAKSARPNTLIILPQLADWAWHELILDTPRYRTMCSQVFGTFLHHVATDIHFDGSLHKGDLDARDMRELDPACALSKAGLGSSNLREVFFSSLAMMRNVYGLSLGDYPDQWLEAGWDTPIYRLRKPIRVPRRSPHLDGDAAHLTDPEELKPIKFLSWLPGRIVERFGISVDAAMRGVQEYCQIFSSLRSSQISKAFEGCSILCEIAWEEHILWTQQYAEDCFREIGYFVDHHSRMN